MLSFPRSLLPLYPHVPKTDTKRGLGPSKALPALGSAMSRLGRAGVCSPRLVPRARLDGARETVTPVPGALAPELVL